jgi:hypothetical protein
MATIIELEHQGVLKLEPGLPAPQQEFRCIYLGPKVKTWIENVLPTLESDRGLEIAPLGQLDDLVAVFCSGATLTYDWQFKPLNYVENGIWELKTATFGFLVGSRARTASSRSSQTPKKESSITNSLPHIRTSKWLHLERRLA